MKKENNLPVKETGVRLLRKDTPRVPVIPEVKQEYDEHARTTRAQIVSHLLIPIQARYRQSVLSMMQRDVVDEIKNMMAHKIAEALLKDHMIDHFLHSYTDPYTQDTITAFEANVVIAKPGMHSYSMIVPEKFEEL